MFLPFKVNISELTKEPVFCTFIILLINHKPSVIDNPMGGTSRSINDGQKYTNFDPFNSAATHPLFQQIFRHLLVSIYRKEHQIAT